MGDILFDNHRRQPRRQTFIIPLTYPDISLGAAEIQRISCGGDIWEMRVDLLSQSSEALGSSNLPPLSYVRDQVRLLQKLSQLPILFTIRTLSQGGKFPDTAEDEALALMLMAVEEGCRYIDVEIEWSRRLIDTIAAKKGETKLVASFHDWTGGIRWTSDILRQKYADADTFGDIIKLSILSKDVYDCHELALFVRNHFEQSPKPLLAVGMGQHGQLSRVLSPISLVTHKLLPAPSAPGQLTLAEVNIARHLVGQLPARRFTLQGSQGSEESVRSMLLAGFRELGLPHLCEVSQSNNKTLNGVEQATVDFTGFTAQGFSGRVSEEAQRVGFVDTITLDDENSATPELVGENLSWRVIHDSALKAGLQVDASNASAVIGGKDIFAVRAACLAVEKLGIKTVRVLGQGSKQDVEADFPSLRFSDEKLRCSLVVYCAEPPGSSCADDMGDAIRGSPSGVFVDLRGSQNLQSVSSENGWSLVVEKTLSATRAGLLFSAWTGRRCPEAILNENV